MGTRMKKANSETIWACAVEAEGCRVVVRVEELVAEERLRFVGTLFRNEAVSEEPRVTFYIRELMDRQSENKLCSI